MKVVFLTLLLGLVCVAQEEEAEQSVSELTGKWKIVYFAFRYSEKESCRLYFCNLVFNEDKKTVEFDVYDESDPKTGTTHVIGTMQNYGTYVFKYDGRKIVFKVAYLSDTVVVLCIISVDDEKCVESPCGVILAVKVSVDQKVMDIFKKLISEKGIKEENIVDFIESEDCPPCGLLDTATASATCT